MRSVTVVLPASMCAMIPMFRVRSRPAFAPVSVLGAVLVIIGLPLEVAERLVGVGHPMGVLAALDRGANAVAGIEQLGGELVRHALAVALAGRLDQPAHAEADAAVGAHLDGDLVRGSADALRLDLDERHRV